MSAEKKKDDKKEQEGKEKKAEAKKQISPLKLCIFVIKTSLLAALCVVGIITWFGYANQNAKVRNESFFVFCFTF
jgi:flagellar basal body-associated protein FliL